MEASKPPADAGGEGLPPPPPRSDDDSQPQQQGEGVGNGWTLVQRRVPRPPPKPSAPERPWDFSKILDGLWHGNYPPCTSPDFFHDRRVTHVMSICSVTVPAEVKAAVPGLVVRHVSIVDHPTASIEEHLHEAATFMHEARISGGSVYVHCQWGVSRSTSLVCAYLMAWLDLSYAEAIAFVRTRRACARPNPGFEAQLRGLEEGGKVKAMQESLRPSPDSAAVAKRLHNRDCRMLNSAPLPPTITPLARKGRAAAIARLLRPIEQAAAPVPPPPPPAEEPRDQQPPTLHTAVERPTTSGSGAAVGSKPGGAGPSAWKRA